MRVTKILSFALLSCFVFSYFAATPIRQYYFTYREAIEAQQLFGLIVLGLATLIGSFIFKAEKPAPVIKAEPVTIVAQEEVSKYPPVPGARYREIMAKNASAGTSHGSSKWDDGSALLNKLNDKVQGGLNSGYLNLGTDYYFAPLAHAITIAGSGQGKGAAIIVPNLLSYPKCSYFILDPKGENAFITARWQRQAGQRVVLLDPWNEQKRLGATHGIQPMGFNPLSFVKSNREEINESCGVIAAMLLPDNPRASDPFWNSRARSLVKTYILHLVTARPIHEQHLGTIYKWLRLTYQERATLWAEMKANMAAGEVVSGGISEFLSMDPERGTFQSILSTAQDGTSFLESELIRQSLSKDDFDPYHLNDGKTTVYLILPERFLESHNRWLRLVVGICLKACNFRPNKRVNFILDEFAILGKMPDIERAYAFARGQNISMWIFVQSLSQLIDVYGEYGANAFLANARVRQFFGVFDLTTQKYLSEYLGEKTITNVSKTIQNSQNTSSGWSAGGSQSEQSMSRRLMTPEEIGKAAPIITLVDGFKFLIARSYFWETRYDLYREKRANFDFTQEEWELFYDQLQGIKPPEQRLGVLFIPRADGHKFRVIDGRVVSGNEIIPQLPQKQNDDSGIDPDILEMFKGMKGVNQKKGNTDHL